MSKKKESALFSVIVFLLFGLVAVIASSAVLYNYPVSILTCRYVSNDQVDGQLQERILGVFSIRNVTIANLRKASVADQIIETRREGRDVETVVYRLNLFGDAGKVTLSNFDDFGGIFVKQKAKKINEFLSAYKNDPIRIWQASWVPLLVSSFFLLVGLLLLYVAVSIVIRGIRNKLPFKRSD